MVVGVASAKLSKCDEAGTGENAAKTDKPPIPHEACVMWCIFFLFVKH